MKRYEFTLAAVLRARQAQEKVALAQLMLARQMEAEAAKTLSDSQAHYGSAATGGGGEGFLAERERWELAGQAVSLAGKAETEAQAGVASALDRYLAAARAVSVVEHLDDRRREEHAAAVQHEEANLVDELVTSRYARARAGRPAWPGANGGQEAGQ